VNAKLLVIYFAVNLVLALLHLGVGIQRKRLPRSLIIVFIGNLLVALPFNIVMFFVEIGRHMGKEDWKR